LVANYFSEYIVDGLLLEYYRKRSQSEPPEKLIDEIERLPISLALKVQLKWSLLHRPINKLIEAQKLLGLIFILIAIFTTILSLTGYLGKLHQILELTSHFKLQYFIVGCSTLFFFLLTRKKIWSWVSLGCILINLWAIVPWYLPPAKVVTGDNVTKIRVLELNLFNRNKRYSEAIALIKEENPDVAVFLEVSQEWANQLIVLELSYPYVFHSQDNRRFGKSIYSKVPLENSRSVSLGKSRKTLVSQLKIDGNVVNLILVHPRIPTKRSSFQMRNEELRKLADYVSELDSPVVLVGDFNTTMWSPYYEELVEKTNLRNARQGFGIQPSWPAHLPFLYIPIDHCLVSPDIQVLKSRTGRNVGSDHLPLITDLGIANG
jgi:endonuclease/exonuclease/phosphatase (EEP) superfamily protein YafD